MGCQTEVELGSNLTFSVTTHDPDTGIVTDADAVPTYRVYEDITEASILNGDMDDGTGAGDQFNDANTTGFYVKRIACTTANGFEINKSYNIYIEATVGGDKGAIGYTFRVTNIYALLLARTSINVISANPAYMHNPTIDQASIVVSQVGLISNKPRAAPIQIAEITTPGLIKVWRYRKGTDAGWTLIVAGGGMAAAVGGIYYSYTFPNADWAEGDLVLYEIYNTVVTLDTEVFNMSTVQGFGVVGQSTVLQAIQADTNELQTDWKNGGRLDLILDTAAAPAGIKKNTALTNFEFYMVLATDHITPATLITPVCQRSIDGAAFANCNTVNATEVSAGIYKIDLAASDLNGDIVTLKFTEATADTRLITIKTVA